MPSGPITIQFSGLFTYIVFTIIVAGSAAILVKKAWDVFFADKKKIDMSVTRAEMELYVQVYVTESGKAAAKEFATACLERRNNCTALANVASNMKEMNRDFREEVRILHSKIETNFLELNGAVRQILQHQKEHKGQ